MKTSTNGVTRRLKEGGLRPGVDVSVRPGRDPEHVRVMAAAGVTNTREVRVMNYATEILTLAGYSIEPGAGSWYINVTKEN